MMKHLLTTTAVTLALTSAGLAQQGQQQPAPADQWQQQQEPQAQQPATGAQAQQGQQQEPTAEAQPQQGEQAEEATTAQPEGEEQQEGEAEVIVVTPEGEEQPEQQGQQMQATGGQQQEGEATVVTPEGGEQPATGAEQPEGEPFVTAQEVGQVRVDKVVGMDVVNPQDEEVGEISDLVFDEEGRLVAAVIGIGGFLGLGKKDVAVSWDRIEWTPRDDGSIELAMPFTREQLEQAPEFKDLETQKAEEEAAAAQQRALQQQPAGAPGGMAPEAAPAQQ